MSQDRIVGIKIFARTDIFLEVSRVAALSLSRLLAGGILFLVLPVGVALSADGPPAHSDTLIPIPGRPVAARPHRGDWQLAV